MSDLLTWAASGFALFLLLTFLAWRRYLWASVPSERVDTCPYSLTDYFSPSDLLRVPHQDGIRWLSEVFSRSAKKYPNLPALQIPHTGESLTFAELDARVEKILTLPDATIICPGHGPMTTVGEEKAHNPFFVEKV